MDLPINENKNKILNDGMICLIKNIKQNFKIKYIPKQPTRIYGISKIHYSRTRN